MNRIVEILLIIGILANLLKGADLILRPKQQARVQQKFETLTLWLDYTKPLGWYTKLKNRKIKVILITISSLLYLSLAVVLSVTSQKNNTEILRWEDGPVYWGASSPMWLPTFILLIIVFTWDLLNPRIREHPVLTYILRGPKFSLFLWRPLLVMAMAAAINLTLLTLSAAFHWSAASNRLGMWIILLYVYIALVGILYGFHVYVAEIELFAMLSLIILCLSAILLISEVILKIIRGIAWRIVEYNKGAFPAIILLVTIILGILEMYLKAR